MAFPQHNPLKKKNPFGVHIGNLLMGKTASVHGLNYSVLPKQIQCPVDL